MNEQELALLALLIFLAVLGGSLILYGYIDTGKIKAPRIRRLLQHMGML